MKVVSVWHLTESGRTLRINMPGKEKSKKNAIVFTRKMPLENNPAETVRLATKEVANAMRLRKFIVLSKGTDIVTGPFTIEPVDISQDGTETNLLINSRYYFLSRVPEIIILLSKDVSVMVPASEPYYCKDSIKSVINFIEKSSASSVILSGEWAKDWSVEIEKICRCSLFDEVFQEGLF